MHGDKTNLNNLILYEIYVRNHGPSGTFLDVIRDLDRIKSLGVDVIWLMPIHPIGVKNKKGTLGCPYSIQDYRKVNPEYGTIDEFQKLIDEAHNIGLKVMIDVVYNHTAHDSVLVKEHPEFFHQDEQGKPITTVPAWSDVIDLKHPNPQLQDNLIDTLCSWVERGVDGFRCDVAPIIPLSFWLEAKRRVETINPDFIWLAESVHTLFIIERRQQGLIAHSDGELYQAFDLTYDYDIWQIWQAAVQRRVPVMRYLELLEFQKGIYPTQAIKMRCVENHDNPRIMVLAPDEVAAKAWTAFEVFNTGAFLIYAGQEAGATHTPSLFDIDKVQWQDYPLQEWLKSLVIIKKSDIFLEGVQKFHADSPAIQASWVDDRECLYGVFNVSSTKDAIPCPCPNGSYEDLISHETIQISDHKLNLVKKSTVIFKMMKDSLPKPLEFDLLSFEIG
jgi:glycosidase